MITDTLPIKMVGCFGRVLVRIIYILDDHKRHRIRRVKYHPKLENGNVVYVVDKRSARGVLFA